MDRQAMVQDIATRTGGDIYIGVVGPVRAGKSTFIRRFMETMVLPGMPDDGERARATDEMPVSGMGRTIMTTQPTFVPAEAARVELTEGARANVRLADCVGYLIKGVMGLEEDGAARMVRTPWFDHDIPFEKAAELGTRRIIREHATLGVLVTTDGTVTDFPRSAYVEAEERVAAELQSAGKPYVVALNTAEPDSDAAASLVSALAEKYARPVIAVNAQTMDEADATGILSALLLEFPLTEEILTYPSWVGALPDDHRLVASLIESAKASAAGVTRVRDHGAFVAEMAKNPYVKAIEAGGIRLAAGGADDRVELTDGLFYEILGEESGQAVEGEEHLLRLMTEMTRAKRAYDRVAEALAAAEESGYGLVEPAMAELQLEPPEIVKQGGRYGVRLRASAPSLHLIRVDVSAEVSPIVGTEEQAGELRAYLLSEFERNAPGIWETNIFGKSLYDMMRDGLAGKLGRMPGDVGLKMRDAIAKIINEGNGGVICILL